MTNPQTQTLEPRPAEEIRIRALRQIWICPLTLRLGRRDDEPGVADQVDTVADELEAAGPAYGWRRVPDLLDHAEPAGPDAPGSVRQSSYSEFVYFHDFVQSVLFTRPEAGAGSPSIRLFANDAVDKVRLTVPGGSRPVTHTGQVERVRLYLFGSGAAALVVEAAFGDTVLEDETEARPATLADTLRLVDSARRCYTPYFKEGAAVVVPTKFAWLKGDRVVGREAAPESLDVVHRHIHRHRTPPMAWQWRDLLAPLRIEGYPGADETGPIWRQVVDERLPTMTWLSLTGASAAIDPTTAGDAADLQRIRPGDWIRLCYADPPGDRPMPYNPGFLAEFEKTACYDRFLPSAESVGSTRFLFAGYHTAVVGSGESFFDPVVLHHFRRHYFQMGLLLTMEFASLLAMSSRITAAVRRRRETVAKVGSDRALEAFRREMMAIHGDFLEMTHLYMFTGLSNQIQPTEIYERWRRTLRLDDIFSDLKTEIEAANQYLLIRHQDHQEREQEGISTAAHVITVIGAVGLGLSLVASVMDLDAVSAWIGAYLPWLAGTNGEGLSIGGHFFAMSTAMAGSSVLMLLLLRWLGRRDAPKGDHAESHADDGGITLLEQIFGAFALVGALFLLFTALVR